MDRKLCELIREDMKPALGAICGKAALSVCGTGVKAPHGILDPSVEQTLQNVGLIADPGMTGTERTIVGIMSGQTV